MSIEEVREYMVMLVLMSTTRWFYLCICVWFCVLLQHRTMIKKMMNDHMAVINTSER